MPLIAHSSYRPPLWWQNRHWQTIYPSAFRRVTGVAYDQRQRLDLPDGDFLDLDWLHAAAPPAPDQPLVILSHGLEGDTSRPYVLGMARAFHQRGCDVLAWNMRGCSGEPNRLERSYHHGESGDLQTVVQYAAQLPYATLALVGFSLGGNVTLKYLGESGAAVEPKIARAVAFSVPCHLPSSVAQLRRGFNQFYGRRFHRKVMNKMRQKAHLLPADTMARILRYPNLDDFTEDYFAAAHGFANADDYYQTSSSANYLAGITVPTLLVNAQNDPMLTPQCSPAEVARQSACVFLETPRQGGHCGFYDGHPDGLYWSERRATAFILSPQPA